MSIAESSEVSLLSSIPRTHRIAESARNKKNSL